MKQQGQIILILILVMTVALAIGLSVIQRSLSDISTASKAEQSARALSAAEAGIENELGNGGIFPGIAETQTTVNIAGSTWLPTVPASGTQDPIQYPKDFYREETANFWLQDPDNLSEPPAVNYYGADKLDIYWGIPTSTNEDTPALELTLVYFDTGLSGYKNQKWYLDPDGIRAGSHGFVQAGNLCISTGYTLSGPLVDNRPVKYYCKYILENLPTSASGKISLLLRARLLYNNNQHPIAVQAVGTCGLACSLPPQARLLKSTGIAGITARTVQVFQAKKVVPFYFDYAIFSQGPVIK